MKHPAHATKVAPKADGSPADGAGTENSVRRSYAGPERRRRRVYVTRNTEYHVDDGTCVAVRNRRTQEFVHGHLALERRVEGALTFFANGGFAPNAGEPKPGESIYLSSDASPRDLVTSPLEAVERPDQATIAAYPTRRGR
jgi:hypothetical protein